MKEGKKVRKIKIGYSERNEEGSKRNKMKQISKMVISRNLSKTIFYHIKVWEENWVEILNWIKNYKNRGRGSKKGCLYHK